ncbi:MAG TPA: hypothetical protein VGE01_11375 [Fimbriimonas sp.]
MFLLPLASLMLASTDLPAIDGDFWTVATSPDLGPEVSTPNQQPVDFSIWKAADGTWQLWSCLRGTKIGGTGRVLIGWEGQSLTDRDWAFKGIQMDGLPEYGETQGGLQAPHVFRNGSQYWMAYGDWNNICFATSNDGKRFDRVVRPHGKTGAFSEGPGANTRDAMVLTIGRLWHCYYTAMPHNQGVVYCRTSRDLGNWSEPTAVAFGGEAGTNQWSSECPHVVKLGSDFYLFKTQAYGEGAVTRVYRSKNPLMFGINQDPQYLVGSLPVAAPEIVFDGGRVYLACLRPDLKGIQIARLNWVDR